MARYAIRGLDLAGDSTEDLVRFLMAAEEANVTVRLTRARGPNGYPVATFYSFNLEDMAQVMLEYCGDQRGLRDYMEMVERVAD
jgi:hypothetical protein